MIRVLVADDQGLVRHGFALILASDPAIQVVAEVSTRRARTRYERAELLATESRRWPMHEHWCRTSC